MATTEKFAAHVSLPSDTEVRVTRSFRAPRTLVWQAHTVPDLARQWLLGYPGWTMPVCEMDVRVGGRYRWRWRQDTDGAEFGFFGTFSEVNEPARLTYDQFYDPDGFTSAMQTDNRCVISGSFTETNGITTLVTTMDFGTKEARDAAVSTGMTDGMEVNYQNLDKVLAGQQGG